MRTIMNLVVIYSLLLSTVVNAQSVRSLSGDNWQDPKRTKTWTPPATTDTLTGNTATQTLTNKTIDADLNTILNTSIVGSTSDDATALDVRKVEIPNSQLTKVADDSYRIETGSTNRFKNPNFEHEVITTGWSNSGTISASPTPYEGKKAIRVSTSTGVQGIYQVYPVSAVEEGNIHSVSVMINAQNTIEVCEMLSTTLTGNCKPVYPTNGKYVPVGFSNVIANGQTHYGIVIRSLSGNTNAVVFDVDAAKGGDKGESLLTANFKNDTGRVRVASASSLIKSENAPYPTFGTRVIDDVYVTRNGSKAIVEYVMDMTTAGTAGNGLYVFTLPSVNGIQLRFSPPLQAQPTSVVAYTQDNGTTLFRLMYGTVVSIFDTEFRLYGGLGNNNAGSIPNPFIVVGSSLFPFSNPTKIKIKLEVEVPEWQATSSLAVSDTVETGKISEVIFTSTTTAPKNFIPTNNITIGRTGATYNGTEYLALYQTLWAQAGTTTTATDVYSISAAKGASAIADWEANKTIRINFTGNEVFIRAKGSARNLGSYQADAFQGHVHTYTSPTGTGTGQLLNGNGYPRNSSNTSAPVTDGTNGDPRTANETRPKNVALNAYIRYKDPTITARMENETFDIHEDERVVGYDEIYGKPIYKRCFDTLPDNSATLLTGVAYMLDVSGTVAWGTASNRITFPFYSDNTHNAYLIHHVSTGNITVAKVGNGNQSVAEFCVKYTKM